VRSIRCAPVLLLLGVAWGTAPACSSTRTVRFEVVDRSSGEALESARLRASPIGTNALPLPVSLANLAESSGARSQTRIVGADGSVRLELYSELPFLLEVLVWPAREGPDAESPPSWVYDPVTGELRTRSRDDGSPVELRLSER